MSIVSLQKTIISGDPFISIGDTISYQFVISAGSSEPVLLTAFVDDLATHDCDDFVANSTVVSLGSPVTCTGTKTVTAADVANKEFTNTATVSGMSTINNIDVTFTDTALATTPRKFFVPINNFKSPVFL